MSEVVCENPYFLTRESLFFQNMIDNFTNEYWYYSFYEDVQQTFLGKVPDWGARRSDLVHFKWVNLFIYNIYPKKGNRFNL